MFCRLMFYRENNKISLRMSKTQQNIPFQANNYNIFIYSMTEKNII